jgi:hypothetical protein
MCCEGRRVSRWNRSHSLLYCCCTVWGQTKDLRVAARFSCFLLRINNFDLSLLLHLIQTNLYLLSPDLAWHRHPLLVFLGKLISSSVWQLSTRFFHFSVLLFASFSLRFYLHVIQTILFTLSAITYRPILLDVITNSWYFMVSFMSHKLWHLSKWFSLFSVL